MFKWKEKGWFKALGLHHGALTGAIYYVAHLIMPLLGVMAGSAMVGMYMRKEWQECKNRGGGLFNIEWLDWIIPSLVVAVMTWYFIFS